MHVVKVVNRVQTVYFQCLNNHRNERLVSFIADNIVCIMSLLAGGEEYARLLSEEGFTLEQLKHKVK